MNTSWVVLVTGAIRGMGAKPAAQQQGVDTAIWLATSEDEKHGGGFFRERKLIDW